MNDLITLEDLDDLEMSEEEMSLILADMRRELTISEEPEAPRIGREPKPFGAQDMAPAINQDPVTMAERKHAFLAMKREGYLIPSDIQSDFLSLEGEGNEYTMDSEGNLGYEDTNPIDDISGFNRW